MPYSIEGFANIVKQSSSFFAFIESFAENVMDIAQFVHSKSPGTKPD